MTSTVDRRARLAGFLYLTIIVSSFLSLLLVESRIVDTADWAATTARIAEHETLYRAGLVYDAVLFSAVVALAWALFVILRDVDRDSALLALLWRMAEAIIGAGTVLLGVLTVLLVHDATMPPAELEALVKTLVTARSVGFDLTILFLSLGSIVYCRLLWRARYVPRWLSGLGVVAFVLMGTGVVVTLLFPGTSEAVKIAWAPGVAFEVAIGVRLLWKGIPALR